MLSRIRAPDNQRKSIYTAPWLRNFLADFGVAISIGSMVFVHEFVPDPYSMAAYYCVFALHDVRMFGLNLRC